MAIVGKEDIRSQYVFDWLGTLQTERPTMFQDYLDLGDDYYDTLISEYNVNPIYIPGDQLTFVATPENVEVGTEIQDSTGANKGFVQKIDGLILSVNTIKGTFAVGDVIETIDDSLSVGEVSAYSDRVITKKIKSLLQHKVSIAVACDKIEASVRKINQDVNEDPWLVRSNNWKKCLDNELKEIGAYDFYDVDNPPPDDEITVGNPAIATWERG